MSFVGHFKNKKVLVTGNTGFKGSWLSLWLHLLGAKVIGVSKDVPTIPSHYKLNNKFYLKNEKFDLSNKKLITNKFCRPYFGIQEEIFIKISISAIIPNDQMNPIKFIL